MSTSLQPPETGPAKPLTLADYLSVLRRRLWILVVLPLASGLVAFVITRGDAPSYQASTTVLLNRANVVSGVTGTQDPSAYDSTRFLETQASIARSPKLAARAARATEISGLTGGDVLGSSTVAAKRDSDLLEFTVSSPTPDHAVLVANAYATEFTKFKNELDTLRVNSAIEQIRSRLETLERRKQEDGAAYQTLTVNLNQLLIGRFLLANSATVLQPADGAIETGASPLKSFVLGALLGLMLAVGIAFLAEALDRRVRSEEELESALVLPLLGRVPRPPDELQNGNQLAMLAAPLSVHSEAFRRVRTNLDFVNLEQKAKTIMFTSALPREGKSTTIANIAVTFARAGRSVALVDLDVRLPTLHTLFDVRGAPGVAEVVLGDVTAERALHRVVLPPANAAAELGNGRRSTPAAPRWSPSPMPKGATRSLGRPADASTDPETALHLLASGRVPAAHAEFLNKERLGTVLAELREMFDLVLIDSPPLLVVGDATVLSAHVDAIVAVVHRGIERPVLRELGRQLGNCRASRLGFVVTGVSATDGYGHGYGYGYGYGYDLEATTTRGSSRAALPSLSAAQTGRDRER